MNFQLNDFTFDLRASLAPFNHIWVGSGYSTVAPLANTVAGVKGLFSPPFAARDVQMLLNIEACSSRKQSMTYIETIGSRIRIIRKLNKINQVDFSNRIGISQATLSELEQDKYKPLVDTVLSNVMGFGTKVEWLLVGEKNSGALS
ncbi:helix-turn-helix domain-containing protein [Paenibacillus piri]|uniref:XRE family transcriptional regulator n=1 Tax=Paenibacillus piri TaxID=2547395 RepID=A0A4R5KA39_9BACL|nr:helix-turn-helix transcriptional regulator [Paenibacillus piri]TDF91702.1 XRE family transcriptional regulator [Paenibacillus piri]